MVTGEAGNSQGFGKYGRKKNPLFFPYDSQTDVFAYEQYVFLQQWEDRLEQGIRFGKVLLLQNLDPQVTSADVRVSENSASLCVVFNVRRRE